MAQALQQGVRRRLTVFELANFSLSGPVVVLQGFVTQPVLKEEAVAAIKTLDWVVHVVDQVEVLPTDPPAIETRQEVYQLLKRQVPSAFPQQHAYIRIKVSGNREVTLYGYVPKIDSKRLENAVVQLEQLGAVTKVESLVQVMK